MSAWEYRDSESDCDVIRCDIGREFCIYCGNRLSLYSARAERLSSVERSRLLDGREYLQADRQNTWAICGVCGWWWAKIQYQDCYSGHSDPADESRWCYIGKEQILRGTVGRLRNLDLADISTPIDEVRSYIAAQPESRFSLHPRRFEEVVASVFQDHGFIAELTAYSADGGIDMVLEGAQSRSVGVQVKRYRGSINVDQIRSFSGALFLGGFTRGVFVTTSRYEAGCDGVAALSGVRGIPIELLDGRQFLDSLGVAQRVSGNRDLPIQRSKLETLPIIEHHSKSLPHL